MCKAFVLKTVLTNNSLSLLWKSTRFSIFLCESFQQSDSCIKYHLRKEPPFYASVAGPIEINIHFCIVRHLPLKTNCLSTLLQQCSTVKYASLSKTRDDLIARTLDFEVDRRKMAGKSCRFFVDRDGSIPSITPFFLGLQWFSRSQVSSTRPLAHYLCLCPCRCRLNLAARFWVPICSC